MYAGYCVADFEGGFIFANGSVLLTRPIKRNAFVQLKIRHSRRKSNATPTFPFSDYFSRLLFPGFIVFLRSSCRKIALLSLPINAALLSLCLIKHHTKEKYDNVCIAPRILGLGTTRMWVIGQLQLASALPPEKNFGTHWKGGWVGLRDDMDAIQKRELIFCSWRNRTPILQLSKPQPGRYTDSESDCQKAAARVPDTRRPPQIKGLSPN
jgi:hypothetical protein